MRQITRNNDPASARDLLDRAPRACLCFASDLGPQLHPITLVWNDGRYLAGVPQGVESLPSSDQEVVLLIDDGVYYFDLRALYIRGHAKPAQAPRGAEAFHRWFEVLPLKTVAWDYGQMREVSDAT